MVDPGLATALDSRLLYDCLILGAGLAGSSVAWHLARRRMRSLVLEQESEAGTHASSQNAAMVRSLVFEPALAPLAIEGARFWNAVPGSLANPGMFRRTGSLLLAGRPETAVRLAKAVECARAAGLHAESWSRGRCLEVSPVLADAPIEAAAHVAEDGVADPAGLVRAFVADPAVTLHRGRRVARVATRGGRVIGVVLESGAEVACRRVVIAAGAWAASLMQTAGVDDRGLRPHRRHLFCTAEAEHRVPGLSIDSPFVWHVDGGVYFRWEAGGVLFSACDEVAVDPGRPGVAGGIDAWAAERVAAVFPFLSELPIARRWAGLRTFRPDHAPLLGPDPGLAGLYHASGLGGHGVTCAAPVGRIVAASIASRGRVADPRLAGNGEEA